VEDGSSGSKIVGVEEAVAEPPGARSEKVGRERLEGRDDIEVARVEGAEAVVEEEGAVGTEEIT